MRITEAPLIGRTLLIGRMAPLLRSGASLVLHGPSGVGKTRVAGELCRRDPRAGRLGDRLLASPAMADRPLSTLAPVASAAVVSATDLAEVYGWFFSRWRERATDDGAALVWLDDAQYIDPLSAAILRQAVSAGVIQLLATHRTPELLPEDLHALHTEGLVDSVEIRPLTPSDTAVLARSSAAHPLTDAQCARVVELSGGNPLYARELAGIVTTLDRDAGWHSLRRVVGRSVDALAPAERRAAELVAVAEPVPAALLAARSDELAVLVRAGLVTHHAEGSLRIDHPLRAAWIVRQLGPLVADVHRELVELAAASGLIDQLDPFTVMEWHLRGGVPADERRAEAATRLAIARSDGATAGRMLEGVSGPARRLLAAQTQILSGDVEGGLASLDAVRRSGRRIDRVEAASWQARYVGVMLGDFARAHALLTSVDDEDLDDRSRRLVWFARAWLWIFGPIERPTDLDRITEIAWTGGVDATTYGLLTCAAALLYHARSPETMDGLIAEIHAIEQQIDVAAPDRCRARAVECWYHVARGDAATGATVCRDELAGAVHRGDAASATMLGGSGAMIVGLHGRLRDAREMSTAALAMADTTDWFNYRRLAELVDLAHRCYLGDVEGARRRMRQLRETASPATSLDLPVAFDARLGRLVSEAGAGVRTSDDLTRAFDLLTTNRKHLWVAVLAAELLDLRDPPDLHRRVRDACAEGAGSGLVASVARLSVARLTRDAQALLDAGLELETAGLPVAASRALADAARVAGFAHPWASVAHCGILRAARAWDGPRMWWIDDLDGLPTSRQAEVAWAVVDGRTVEEIADRLTLSRRTIENHLYRACRALGVSGRAELAAALTPPPRPARRLLDGRRSTTLLAAG